jgi:5-methylcytosine-specific restriction protein B
MTGEKCNLILQGAPGTGKTWLARRLAYALVGERDEQRVTVLQFHPSLSYEDFVRGWRPSGDGRLQLVDGAFLRAAEAAKADLDRRHVVVIEEINRGNPAQIFGELLTLLESTKRTQLEAISLAYPRPGEGPVYLPPNLIVIGTMNIADRSLALVDLALRRRFAFVMLEPRLGPEWRQYCEGYGMNAAMVRTIEDRMTKLNKTIADDRALGPAFRIGHSVVTPESQVIDTAAWFEARITSEIAPLLEEYWYDRPEAAAEAVAELRAR